MRERNLYRIVEVSMKRESGRKEIGIMTYARPLSSPGTEPRIQPSGAKLAVRRALPHA